MHVRIVMSVLRSMDSRHARRGLREAMCEMVPARSKTSIPHAFDSEALLEASRAMLERPEVRHHRSYRKFLALTGRAHVLNGHDDEGRALLERGLAEAETNQSRALFRFHIGHYIHQRGRNLAAAREELTRAYRLSERGRRLRTITLLALGSVEDSLGRYDAATKTFRAARDLRVRDLEPLALLRLANVLRHRGELDEAERINRESHERFDQLQNWLGVNISDAYFGLLKIDGGENAAARDTFERVVESEFRVLDVMRLGRTYNNLSIACLRLRDYAAARDAIVEAIHYNARFNRRTHLAGNYHNLGRCLTSLGEYDASFAAFERSVECSRALDDSGFEFETLTDVLNIVSEHRVREDVVPAVLARSYELLKSAAGRLSHKRVVEFGQMTRRILERERTVPVRFASAPPALRLASKRGRDALEALLPCERERDFDVQLSRRIGDGPGGRLFPTRDELSGFLLLYAGDYFKSGHYTGEFGLTQERAKRHLRWMCTRRLIERYGSRKASRYALAFHRSPVAVASIVSSR